MKGETGMLKLEIKLDEEKIRREGKYTVESIYRAVDKPFQDFHLLKVVETDGIRIYHGTGSREDYGAFGAIITTYCEKSWFMDYVTKWIWYNSDRGRDEEDFSVEDVLYFYTKKESMAW